MDAASDSIASTPSAPVSTLLVSAPPPAPTISLQMLETDTRVEKVEAASSIGAQGATTIKQAVTQAQNVQGAANDSFRGLLNADTKSLLNAKPLQVMPTATPEQQRLSDAATSQVEAENARFFARQNQVTLRSNESLTPTQIAELAEDARNVQRTFKRDGVSEEVKIAAATPAKVSEPAPAKPAAQSTAMSLTDLIDSPPVVKSNGPGAIAALNAELGTPAVTAAPQAGVAQSVAPSVAAPANAGATSAAPAATEIKSAAPVATEIKSAAPGAAEIRAATPFSAATPLNSTAANGLGIQSPIAAASTTASPFSSVLAAGVPGTAQAFETPIVTSQTPVGAIPVQGLNSTLEQAMVSPWSSTQDAGLNSFGPGSRSKATTTAPATEAAAMAEVFKPMPTVPFGPLGVLLGATGMTNTQSAVASAMSDKDVKQAITATDAPVTADSSFKSVSLAFVPTEGTDVTSLLLSSSRPKETVPVEAAAPAAPAKERSMNMGMAGPSFGGSLGTS